MAKKSGSRGSHFFNHSLFEGLTTLALLALLAFVAPQRAPHQIFAFHRFQSSFCFVTIWHFYKTESTAPTSFAVMNDLRTLDFPVGFKRFSQDDVIDAPSKISNKNVHY